MTTQEQSKLPYCKKEKQFIDSGFTVVDNKFILNYMTGAHDKAVVVYLLGLALCNSDDSDNTAETIARKAEISVDEVKSVYYYWEEMGLVHITPDEKIIYLSLKDSAKVFKKFKPSAYTKFNKQMQDALPGKMITTNEYYEYYNFLEETTFQPEALVAVAKYCAALRGSDINYRYILTVARNLYAHGLMTLETVGDNLDSQKKYDDDLKILFKDLGLSRKFDHSDREFYEKWTKSFGFTLDVICGVAKSLTRKTMEKLDAALCDYYKKGVLSLTEIEHYNAEKEHYGNLAGSVTRALGLYYQSYDAIIDEYLIGWLSKGYDDETLLAVAKYCFRTGIRSLAGYAVIVDKLYKNGITDLNALDGYLQSLAATDTQIKQVLEKAGIARNVTNNDRTLYRTWTSLWNMPQDLICFAAEKSAGTLAPLAYINKILATYKQKNIFTVEQAQSEKLTTASSAAAKRVVIGEEIERHSYTDEQLNSLFTALDDTEDR